MQLCLYSYCRLCSHRAGSGSELS